MTTTPLVKKDSEAAQFIVNTYKVALAGVTGITEDQAGVIAREAIDGILESEDPPATTELLARRMDLEMHLVKFAIKLVSHGSTPEERKRWFRERREALDAFFSQPLPKQLQARDDLNSRFYLDGPWVIDRLNVSLKP